MADTYDVKRDIEGDSTSSTSDDKTITYSATLGYTIVLGGDASADDSETVRQNAALPLPRQSVHPNNIYLLCESVNIQKVGVPYYKATATFQSAPFEPGGSGDPTQKPVEVSWSTLKSQEPIDEYKKDGNWGYPLANAGTNETISGITRPISDTVGTFKKNILLYDPVTFYQYVDRVNELDWAPGAGATPFPAGTMRVDDIQADQVYEGQELPYWKLVVKIVARYPYKASSVNRAWWKRIKCEGYLEVTTDPFNPAETTVGRITKNGEYATKPALLNKDTGFQLYPEDEPPTIQVAQFNEFEVFDSFDFAAMGLV